MWERCTPLLQISIYEWIDKIKNGRFFPGWASEGNGVYLIYCLSTETVFIYRQKMWQKILKRINQPESSTVQLLREK